MTDRDRELLRAFVQSREQGAFGRLVDSSQQLRRRQCCGSADKGFDKPASCGVFDACLAGVLGLLHRS